MTRLLTVELVTPQPVAQKFDELLVLDAQCPDVATRQELLRLFLRLVHVRRARKAIFLRHGCGNCHRKKIQYGAGGLCNRCAGREYKRIKAELQKMHHGRNAAEETAALTQRFDVAQWLLNGDDSE